MSACKAAGAVDDRKRYGIHFQSALLLLQLRHDEEALNHCERARLPASEGAERIYCAVERGRILESMGRLDEARQVLANVVVTAQGPSL